MRSSSDVCSSPGTKRTDGLVRERAMRTGIVLAFLAGLGWLLKPGTPAEKMKLHLSVLPASFRTGAPPSKGPAPTPLAITVDVDVHTHVMAQPKLPGLDLAGAQAALAAWTRWGHREGTRVLARCSESEVPVVATHDDAVTTLLLVNSTGRPLQVRLKARLAHGVYTIERLTFAAPNETAGFSTSLSSGQNAQETAEAGKTPKLLFSPVLERLEGCNLTHASSVEKKGYLEPGQATLYRFVDRRRTVTLAWTETYRLLHRLALRHSEAAGRIRRSLNENHSALNGLRDSVGLRSQLEGIHQLLLAGAQAQAIHQDYRLHGGIDAETSVLLMQSLDHLIDGLSETAAVRLGLIPQVSVEPNGPLAQTIAVTLANTGPQTVASVKLGLQAQGLPEGATCEPIDSAYFGTLKSGQTARAVFHLRLPSTGPLGPVRCVADVCYFVGNGPAHLRPRPWSSILDEGEARPQP